MLDLLGLGEHPCLLDEGDQVVVAGLQVPAPHHVAEDAPPGGLVQLPGLRGSVIVRRTNCLD